jgi:signal transduction histidine kinase
VHEYGAVSTLKGTCIVSTVIKMDTAITAPSEGVAQVSYELKHSLTRIRLLSEALNDDVIEDSNTRTAYMNAICMEVANLDRFANQLLALTRPGRR